MNLAQCEVDIRTRIFADGERLYILFPGDGYRHFPVFERRSIVFLDFPGMELPLRDGKVPPNIKELIARSEKLRAWHRSGAKIKEEPSRALDDYKRSRRTKRRVQYAAAIQTLYFDLKPGTVIIVPGPGSFGRVRVGELEGGVSLAKIAGYGEDRVPVRRVRWIADVPKREFSEPIANRLRLPIPLFVLERSLEVEVIKKAYENYAYGGEYVATFETTTVNFDSLDDFNIQAFVNFVAGALAAIDLGEVAQKVDLERALDILAAHPERIPELNSNINSPGVLRYITQDINSLVVAVVLALALSGSPMSASAAVVVNSAAGPNDPCAYVIDEKVKQAFEVMDIFSLKTACERSRDASEKTGLRTTVKVQAVKPGKEASRGKRK